MSAPSQDTFMQADRFAAYIHLLASQNGIDADIGREIARTAGTAWVTGYNAAVKTITAKARTMCNQRQIMEYLEGIKL